MNFPVLDVFLSIFWFFACCLWVSLVVWTVVLIFRSQQLSGWAKAGWLILVVLVPILGVAAYLIARGAHLAGEQIDTAHAPADEALRSYERFEARGRGGADELTRLADLRDRGIITDAEFQQAKVQILR
jgi:Short C-terminal domain/Phospholipase_D-nuclease N-terminal